MRKDKIRYREKKCSRKESQILSGTAVSVLLTILLLFRLPVINAQTQVYPVSVTTQLTPPYSVNLADYVAPGCEQLKVIIVQRDLTQAPYRLYLKMEIELNGRTIIRTSPNYIPPAFTLEPGIPTLISGSSLAPFFDPANMDFTGYSRDLYMRTKILPEGAYVITFTAYDWTRRDIALSHGGSFFCYLAKTAPPMLNLPFNNALVTTSSPQYINFQWLPGTSSSPNSAFSTKYRFELFEMRVGGISPSEIVTNSRPFFVSETDRTNLLYTISEPALEKGMRYVWRVRAYDIQGRDYIRNNGMSEVFSFVYGEGEGGILDFGEIGNFVAGALSPRKAKLSWDAAEGYDRYRIFYRKLGKENKWYESEAVRNSAELNGLSPGTVYECRVQGKKMNAWGSFSNTDTVLMPKLPVIECGSPFTPLEVSNREPLLELMRLQEFDAGGFMVTVIDPYALTTEPGRFTGRGFVQVPLFGHKKIRCEFTDIFINTDFQMIEGSIRLICDHADGKNAIWDVDEVFEGGTDNGTVIGGREEVALVIPDVVITLPESIMLDTTRDEIMVIVESQDTIRINVAEKLKENPGSLTVQDSEGNLYSVDTKTGKAASIGKVSPPGTPQQLATPLPEVIDDRKGKVIFEAVPEQTSFAFDRRNAQYARSNIFMEEYKTMKTEDGELYDIPYKLIPVGETDVVLARAELKSKTINSDSIVFRSGTGTIYKAQPSGKKDEYLLTLPSGKANDGIDVYATYTDSKGKTYVLGKMIVLSYPVRQPRLTLVPVNGNGTDIDAATVKEELDKIYYPVGVDWQVNLDDNFETTVDSLDIEGSGLFSMYTEGMKKLNNEFVMFKQGSFDPSAVYLFLLRHSDDKLATGDMPRGKQFGYIFTETARSGGNAAFYRTIAHEIAHGTFSLSHTFDEKYQIAEKSTTNLLDYTAGTDLVKHQWDAIHDPGLVIGMFERDEEGKSKVTDGIYVNGILNAILCAKKNNQSEIDVSGYKKLERQDPGVFWSSELPGISYLGECEVTLKYASSQSKNTLSINIINQVDNVVTIGDNTNCKLEISIKRNLYPSVEDAEKFAAYLKGTSDEINSNIENLMKQLDGMVNLSAKIQIVPTCWYSEINNTRRVEYLNKLASKPDDNINTILKLVNTTKKENVAAFFAELGKSSIFYNFKNSMSFANYSAFVRSCTFLFYQQEGLKDKLVNLPYNMLFINEAREGSLGASISNSFAGNETTITITGNVSVVTVTTNAYGVTVPSGTKAFQAYSYQVGYCDLIGLELVSDFAYLKASVHNDIIPLPAFYFDWLNANIQRESTIRSIDITFTVASLAIGLGELKAISKVGRFVFAVKLTGVVKSSIDLVLLNQKIYNFIETGSSSGASFLSNWRKFSIMYDLATFDLRNVNKDRNFFNDFNITWNLTSMALKENLSDEVYAQVEILLLEIEQELKK